MNLQNRFFFKCTSCFLKITADVEGLRRPQVEQCPVCNGRFHCLGATRGVLSVGVPCNDKCVFAEGVDCSCSCGGRNHGSKLLVPVISGVVNFSGAGPLWMVDGMRERWAKWQGELARLRAVMPPAFASPPDEETRASAARWRSHACVLLYECDTWAAREKALGKLYAAFPFASPVRSPAGIAEPAEVVPIVSGGGASGVPSSVKSAPFQLSLF